VLCVNAFGNLSSFVHFLNADALWIFLSQIVEDIQFKMNLCFSFNWYKENFNFK